MTLNLLLLILSLSNFSCISRKLNSITVHDLAKNSYFVGLGVRGVGVLMSLFWFLVSSLLFFFSLMIF